MKISKEQFLDKICSYANFLICTGLCVWNEEELSRTEKWLPHDDNGELIMTIQHTCSIIRHFRHGIKRFEEQADDIPAQELEDCVLLALEISKAIISYTQARNPDLEVRLWLGELSRHLSNICNMINGFVKDNNKL